MQTTLLALVLLALALLLSVSGLLRLLAADQPSLDRGASSGPGPPMGDSHASRRRGAGTMLLAAAGPPLLVGILLLVRPPAELEDWFLLYAAAGVATGGLLALARRQLAQDPEPDTPDRAVDDPPARDKDA